MEPYRAQREATYEAETPVGRVDVRVGRADRRLRRLLDYLSAEFWAFLTAWNAGENFGDEGENRRRQKKLDAELEAAGYRTFSGSLVPDHPDWAPEECTLVVGMEAEEALRFGRDYGQEVVVWGRADGVARLLECASGDDVTDDTPEGAERGESSDSELDEVLSELGGTVRQSVQDYRSEPRDPLQNAVDWELVLRSLDEDPPESE